MTCARAHTASSVRPSSTGGCATRNAIALVADARASIVGAPSGAMRATPGVASRFPAAPTCTGVPGGCCAAAMQGRYGAAARSKAAARGERVRHERMRVLRGGKSVR